MDSAYRGEHKALQRIAEDQNAMPLPTFTDRVALRLIATVIGACAVHNPEMAGAIIDVLYLALEGAPDDERDEIAAAIAMVESIGIDGLRPVKDGLVHPGMLI